MIEVSHIEGDFPWSTIGLRPEEATLIIIKGGTADMQPSTDRAENCHPNCHPIIRDRVATGSIKRDSGTKNSNKSGLVITT
jgi:hypothetical protein